MYKRQARHRLVAYDNFIETPLDVRDGKLHMSDAPGLGIEMNMDFMRANSDKQFRGE